MKPFLFALGGVPIASYSVLLVTAISVLLVVGVAVAARRGLPGHHMAIVLTLGYVAGLAGGRLAWVLQNAGEIADPVAALLAPRIGGLTVHGGFLGGAAAALLYALALRLPIARMADAAVLGLGLAAAIGRMGCLLAGCCYGRPTRLPWGIVFPAAAEPTERFGAGVAVHPTQAYEALALVTIALVCHRMGRPGRPAGRAFAGLVLGYAVFRFAHELVRADSSAVLLGLTPAQCISLALAAAAGSFLALLNASERRPVPPDIEPSTARRQPCAN